MSKMLSAGVIVVWILPPAFGSDFARQQIYSALPPTEIAAAYHDWSGFYAGVNHGWGSSQNSWYLNGTTPEGSHDASGGTLGAQIGRRWQAARTVFGVEARANWSDFKGSNNSEWSNSKNQTALSKFGLLTGQLGYAFGEALLYATAGAAVASTSYKIYSDVTGQQLATADIVRWGLAVGGGVDVKLATNWFLGVEYNHLFMPDNDVDFSNSFGKERIHQGIDLVAARLNYKFGDPMAAHK
ncbi:outer membrane protein [Bradyrhizobium sp. DOA9]|uniref:outer membrane protein n=1 Tax=Bradyrhizobium sp. DOA9 TaxID=1126627 RepID=UPI0005A6B88B|nr:outer membrane beta-barrel protein [Bradyrhizobium sp. DOA9]